MHWGSALIDSFMMCLFMVAFRLHLQTPDESTIPPSSFDAIDVVVVPQAGMFTFMGATVSSLLAGHLMLALHRQAMGVSREDTGKDGSVPEAVVGASNGRSRLCSSVHKRWGALVLVVLITCAAQVAVGVFSETFASNSGPQRLAARPGRLARLLGRVTRARHLGYEHYPKRH